MMLESEQLAICSITTFCYNENIIGHHLVFYDDDSFSSLLPLKLSCTGGISRKRNTWHSFGDLTPAGRVTCPRGPQWTVSPLLHITHPNFLLLASVSATTLLYWLVSKKQPIGRHTRNKWDTKVTFVITKIFLWSGYNCRMTHTHTPSSFPMKGTLHLSFC